MIDQLAILAFLKISEDPPERERKWPWLEEFLRKLKRTSTRTQKCRLIASVERVQFEDDENAYFWKKCGFVEGKGMIFFSSNKMMEDFKMTQMQKMIIASETDEALENRYIGRWEIKEENGNWNLPADLRSELISEGGEALVISQNFGELKTAVRVQIFDPFLFTAKFAFDSLSWKIHCEKGKSFHFSGFKIFRFRTSFRQRIRKWESNAET